MTLLIPAIWYRARAIIERRWGWSPVEEEVLLALRDRPGTSASVAGGTGTQLPDLVIAGMGVQLESGASCDYASTALGLRGPDRESG